MTSLESARSFLEELQTIESAIATRFQRNPDLFPKYDKTDAINHKIFKNKKTRGYKHNLLQSLEISRMIDHYFKLRENLSADFKQHSAATEEKNNASSVEFGLDQFDQLYQQQQQQQQIDDTDHVRSLRSLYSMRSTPTNILSEFASNISLGPLFSGEESLGKYLDLIKFHEDWLNLNNEKLSYVKWLDIIDQFQKYDLIKGRDDRNKLYLKYLVELNDYLIGFVERVKPLFDIQGFLKNIEQEQQQQQQNQEPTDALYCKYCRKTFSKDTVFQGHLSGKKHLKFVENFKDDKDYKFWEHQIQQIFQTILQEHLVTTKLNTERKRALTEREKEIEIRELEKDEPFSDIDSDSESSLTTFQSITEGAVSTHDEDDHYDNNPMNLPLGPDGQPIPFWLYKLQGLGKEYQCEICGNDIYKGRKAFNSHFTNARHAHGLRCLGIEPSSVFKDIVKMDEAVNLWESMRNGKKKEGLIKEESVQVEDASGNVMSAKVYNDLKNQGLL